MEKIPINEQWKQIENYSDYYISNFGRVKSLRVSKLGKMLKQSPDGDGYLIVKLYNDNGYKVYRVNRLVAIYFIPNPENKPEVNHKDGIKTNNHIDNLEWTTNSENTKHAFNMGLMLPIPSSQKQKEALINFNITTKKKPIEQLDRFTGEIIKEWDSAVEAEKQLGIDKSSIGRCCMGKALTSGGFKFRFKK